MIRYTCCLRGSGVKSTVSCSEIKSAMVQIYAGQYSLSPGPSILIGRHNPSYPDNTQWEPHYVAPHPLPVHSQPGGVYHRNISFTWWSDVWRVRSVGGPLSLLDWGGEFLFWHKVCCCLSDGSWFICHNIPLFVIKLDCSIEHPPHTRPGFREWQKLAKKLPRVLWTVP